MLAELLESLVSIMEWPDSSGNDDHGRGEGGGFSRTSHGSDYRGHKPEGAAHTQFGSKTETHRHEITSYTHGETGERVTVDHDTKTGKVDVLSSKRGQSKKFADTKSAAEHLKSKGIEHDFGG